MKQSNFGRIMDNLVSLSSQTAKKESRFTDLTLHMGPSSIPAWNIVFCKAVGVESLSGLNEICRGFFHDQPYRVTVLVESDSEREDWMFRQTGFGKAKELSLMVLDPGGLPDNRIFKAAKDNVTLSDDSLGSWVSIFADVFLEGKDSEEYHEIFAKARLVKRLVAFVGGSPASIISYFSYKKVGQIGSVATLKQFRGMGLAKLLLEHCLNSFSRMDDLIYLTVREDNSFIDFYRGVGFKDVGKQVYYIPSVET